MRTTASRSARAKVIALPLLLVLSLPLLEIAAFVVVGGAIGVLPTIGLVLLSAMAGLLLLQRGGAGALAKARMELQAGRDPGPHLTRAAMTMVSALLLIVPGFVTDAAGLLLLIPTVRGWVWRFVKGRIAGSRRFAFFGTGFQTSGRAEGFPGDTIDLGAEDYSAGGNPSSPWRIEKRD